MAFGITKSRPSPIAIDFGADTLKCLQIIPGDPPELIALASVTVPEHARTDLNSRMKHLAEALPAALRQQPFRGRRVMLSIPAFQTLIHNLDIPKSDPKDLDQLVQLALRERLNVEPSRMVIRNFPAADVTRGGAARQEVVTLAAGRDVVMRYLDLANRCKLEVAGMHSEPPCLLRAFAATAGRDAAKALMYVDLGAATTKLIVAHGQTMVLAKTIHAGGDQLVRKLAEAQRIGFDEARLARLAEASGGGGGGVATVRSTATSTTAFDNSDGEETCDTLDCLIDEMRLTLRHYRARHPERPVHKIIFVGGEATQTRLCQRLARALGVAAQLGDPFARLSRVNAGGAALGLDLSRPQPGWAVPLGLCLSDANL